MPPLSFDPKEVLTTHLLVLQEEHTAFSTQIDQYSAQVKQKDARISELETHLIALYEMNLQLEGATKVEDKHVLRIAELEQQLLLARSERLSINRLDSNDPSVFENESLQRLKEWKRNIEYCIDQAEDREEEARLLKKKMGEDEREKTLGQKKTGGMEQQKKRTETDESMLPFSHLGLSGYLNRNHRLTQKYTDYPEPRPKGEKKEPKAKEKQLE